MSSWIKLIFIVHLSGLLFPSVRGQHAGMLFAKSVERVLEQYNAELKYYKHLGAELAWNISTDMSKEVLGKEESSSYNLVLPHVPFR
jgi:hypothetical protein